MVLIVSGYFYFLYENICFLFQLESQVCEGENSVNDVMSPSSSAGTEDTIITDENDLSTVATPTNSTVTQQSSIFKKKGQTRDVKRKSTQLADEVLKTVSQQLNNAVDDKFDTSGKNIANKLRTLPPEIAIVTEKLLCDVLFEAQMGNITRFTKVILQVNHSQSQHIQSSQSQQFDSTSTQQYYSTFATDLENVISF